MAPIRVGIIGLSARAATSWASRAHLPYLLASNGKYEIKALCNSSVDTAQAAIDAYKLPSSTKAYGDPQALANDPDIDLVVCSVRVDAHYKTIKPSIEAGKDVYVEWPLAANLEDATELATLAREKGVKTMVSLQGRVSPVYLKVKALLAENRIGKVFSSSVVASDGTKAPTTISESLKYFLDRRVGGNLLTIFFGHLVDSIHNVLGPFTNTKSTLATTRSHVNILSPSGKITETIASNIPDHIIYSGKLLNSENAPISMFLRRGAPFKDTPGFVWSILGETGEIRVVSASPSIQAFDHSPRILVESFESGDVQEVDVEEKQSPFKLPAKNIATLYEAFASGEKGTFPDFDDAVGLHKELGEMLKEWDAEGGH
ncbi:MAG: hypothetical protein Q9195_000159 [Heterodermia aff. obscurata]